MFSGNNLSPRRSSLESASGYPQSSYLSNNINNNNHSNSTSRMEFVFPIDSYNSGERAYKKTRKDSFSQPLDDTTNRSNESLADLLKEVLGAQQATANLLSLTERLDYYPDSNGRSRQDQSTGNSNQQFTEQSPPSFVPSYPYPRYSSDWNQTRFQHELSFFPGFPYQVTSLPYPTQNLQNLYNSNNASTQYPQRHGSVDLSRWNSEFSNNLSNGPDQETYNSTNNNNNNSRVSPSMPSPKMNQGQALEVPNLPKPSRNSISAITLEPAGTESPQGNNSGSDLGNPESPNNNWNNSPQNSPTIKKRAFDPSDSSHLALVETTKDHNPKKFLDLTEYLNLPQGEAAKRLGVPTSTLSKRWKEAVVNRKWPYRTVQKIDKEITTLLHNISPPLSTEIEETLGVLLKRRQEELRPVLIRKG